jgi:HEAT repeat protein
MAGHAGDATLARAALDDPDPGVRSSALGALERTGTCRAVDLVHAMDDPAPSVRRTACELAGRSSSRSRRLLHALGARLADDDALVTEAAVWALGERREATAVTALAAVASGHDDVRCRESAVGALGSIGDPAGLPAVLAALEDRPAIRRRAVVALAAFEGPDVEAALARALGDRDWQVRQAAEILTGAPPGR